MATQSKSIVFICSMAMNLQLGITLFCCALFLTFVLLVTFGFNQTTYSVREDASNISIGVSVINGTISGDEILTLSTAAGGTATGRAIKIIVVCNKLHY